MNSSDKAIKLRLFLTCWLIFSLHFATDFVREHYLVLSIVEDFSFRLDKYADLHPDIFQTPKRGAHHGANPGASMIAAIPYFVLKPAVDTVVSHYPREKKGGAEKRPAVYKDNRPARVKFYEQVRERGLDIKFALVGFITVVFCMAPLSALATIMMFQTLNRLGLSKGESEWMAILFAFGTPVFFRTAYLNQNLMVGIFAFIAFVKLWQMEDDGQKNIWRPMAFAGFLGGIAVLCDYSGLISLILLYGYGLLRLMDLLSGRQALKKSLWYFLGASGPILLLWFYQGASFGYPFYPPQHFMPPQIYSDVGYQGIFWPQKELIWLLLFDQRFGLFVICPIVLLAFLGPFYIIFRKTIVPVKETLFILSFFVAFTFFFSCMEYTRLQWVTGIRYMVPVIPLLFLLTAVVLIRLPKFIYYGIIFINVGVSWSMSMARRGVGVPEESMLESIFTVMSEGPQLPWLNTLSKMSVPYVHPLFLQVLSPVPIFILVGLIIYGIWRIKLPSKKSNQFKVIDEG